MKLNLRLREFGVSNVQKKLLNTDMVFEHQCFYSLLDSLQFGLTIFSSKTRENGILH